MGKSINIVFMGTPEFAVASLERLSKSDVNIAGIITAPDKPAGRGNKLQMSDVKKFALEHNIHPILQPDKLKDPLFIEQLKSLNADLFVVVAFRMLPEVVWSMPRLGTINLHASLLPNYRGAAPINWAIINGEKKTGVTTFFIEKDIDTGKIIMQESVRISDDDNAGTLHDKLMLAGSKLLAQTIETIKGGFYEALPQQKLIGSDKIKAAPKIFKDDCRIKWDAPVKDVYNFIRGLSPYPCSWTEFRGRNADIITLKIFESKVIFATEKNSPGTVSYNNTNEMLICCQDGALSITSLQQSGKNRIDIGSFLRGFNNKENYTLAT